MKRQLLTLLAILLISIGFANAQNYFWSVKTSLPAAARECATSFSVGGKGYLGLGRTPGPVIHDDFWEYDANNDSWTQKSNYAGGVRYGAASFVINDTAYVGTGWSASASFSDFYRYDQVNNQWIAVASYPGNPSYSNVFIEINGKGYMGIGYAPYSNEWWEYNPTMDLWTQKTSFPGSLRQSCSGFVLNGKGYIGLGVHEVGGPNFIPCKDFYEYDATNDLWTQIPDFGGTPRWGTTAFTLMGKAYLLCGYDWSVYNNEVWEFDPFTYSWTQLSNFPGLPRYASSCFTIGNAVYFGTGSAGTYFNDFWKFGFVRGSEISGKTYFDDNNNQSLDAGEIMSQYTIVEVNPGPEYYSTGTTGKFKAWIDTGTYTVTVPSPPQYFTCSPVSNGVSFPNNGGIDTSSIFGFYSANSLNDLRITLTPVNNARPGEYDYYNITYKNVGTTAMNGNVQLNFDSLLSFIGTIPTDTNVIQTGNSLQWNFTGLTPGESRIIRTIFLVSQSAIINDTIFTTALVNPVIGDNYPPDNYDSSLQLTVNSCDPNLIEVNYNKITPSQVTNQQWLEYTVHFQNTGTAPAINIRLTDTLSSELWIPSIEILSSSHPCSFELKGQGIAQWKFENIMLPDSFTNEALSHGFVKYRIKPKNNLIIGDSILASAGIYFDYNSAVITNVVSTVISQPNSVPENSQLSSFNSVYPNPNNGQFAFKMNERLNTSHADLKIYNAVGILVYSGVNYKIENGVAVFNVQHLSNGIYYFRLSVEEKNFNSSFIIIY